MAFNFLESQVKISVNRLARRPGRAVAVAVVVALAAALVVAGCPAPDETIPAEAVPDATPVTPATPVDGDALVVAYPTDVDSLNPLIASSDLSGQILDFLFPLLVMPTFDCRCSYRPHLARSWRWSEDGLTLTFELRDDVRWSDGEPVDSDDVRFTLELIQDPAVASGYAAYLEHLRADDPVETPDAGTVVVHFARRYDADTMLSHVGGCPIVPRHVLEQTPRSELRGAPFGSAPVTAGSFHVGRWDRGRELVLERTADSPVTPHLDRVVFRVIPEYTTRLVELERGDVDLVAGIQVEDAERLSGEGSGVRVVRRGQRYLDYIAWNLRDERFAAPGIRRALAHAVDADALIDALLRAGDERYGTRAVGTITPELCDLRNPDLAPIPHDPAKAAELFAEAGWRDSDGDGWLDRDGERFAFTLETNASNPRRVQAQVIVQDQLRQVGVDVALATYEGNAFFERLQEGKFEAALTGWGAALVVDPSRLWKSDGVYNFPGYASPEVDALIERGLAAVEPGEARDCWQRLQATVHADQPVCFLYWRDELVAIRERFRDVGISTLWLFEDLHHWWVPGTEQRHRR